MAKSNSSKKKDAGSKPEESTQVVPFQAGSLVLPAGVTIKRHVTLPSLAIKNPGQAEILTILDPMRVSKIKQKVELDSAGKPKAPREPATICTVGRHAGEHNPSAKTGQFTFIVPAVVRENLERDYPADADGVVGYVGKSFYIVNCGKRTESQRYNDFQIAEADVAPQQ
jgi:hypothetical protein